MLRCELDLTKPKPLKTFILHDPKTRKISKSDFRDRIVHHAIVNILEPIFDKFFIYDSCANRKGKTKMPYVKEFEKNLTQNLLDLREELLLQTYKPVK